MYIYARTRGTLFFFNSKSACGHSVCTRNTTNIAVGETRRVSLQIRIEKRASRGRRRGRMARAACLWAYCLYVHMDGWDIIFPSPKSPRESPASALAFSTPLTATSDKKMGSLEPSLLQLVPSLEKSGFSNGLPVRTRLVVLCQCRAFNLA